jgi:hypothetical protein
VKNGSLMSRSIRDLCVSCPAFFLPRPLKTRLLSPWSSRSFPSSN